MQRFDASKDYYKVLGISEEATVEEIEKAFRSEARKRHPDGGGSEEEMKLLNEAHDILSDPQTRRAYDAQKNPRPAKYGSSIVLDPEPVMTSEAFKVQVSDEDFAGLLMSAATCIGLSLPLLFLVETQWVFFLWPLRLIALGTLGIGVIMSHAALKAKHRAMRRRNPNLRRSVTMIHRLIFYSIVIAGLVLIVALYMA
jgi:hypothetical protein